MSDVWYLRNPDGLWSAPGRGDLPADLGAGGAGTAAILFDGDGMVEEVREWNGKAWDLITGREQEALIGWLQS